jgi:hypothetical protein
MVISDEVEFQIYNVLTKGMQFVDYFLRGVLRVTDGVYTQKSPEHTTLPTSLHFNSYLLSGRALKHQKVLFITKIDCPFFPCHSACRAI